MLKIVNLQFFSTGSFCQVYRVTDGALIAETAVWPNFFLMNIFFALKETKLFIIIRHGKILFLVSPTRKDTYWTAKLNNIFQTQKLELYLHLKIYKALPPKILVLTINHACARFFTCKLLMPQSYICFGRGRTLLSYYIKAIDMFLITL